MSNTGYIVTTVFGKYVAQMQYSGMEPLAKMSNHPWIEVIDFCTQPSECYVIEIWE